MATPELPVEHLLHLAANDPGHRPEFLRTLLEADVLILGSTDQPLDGGSTLPAGASVSITHWNKPDGSTAIPFFTSLAALQRAIREPENYLQLPARSLFEMTCGATLFLNPRSDYGKEFVPEEIAALLETGSNFRRQTRVVEEPTQVLLAQPKEQPAAMLAALRTLFVKHTAVQAAYCCLMHDPSVDAEPHLVIGIEGEGEGDLAAVGREAGAVAAETSPNRQPVDLVVVVRGATGLSDYFVKSVEPFYRR